MIDFGIHFHVMREPIYVTHLTFSALQHACTCVSHTPYLGIGHQINSIIISELKKHKLREH